MKLFTALFITAMLVFVSTVNADPNNPSAPGLSKPVVNPVTGAVTPVKHPPGWEHGKKRGWHGNTVPPGQAKKELTTKHMFKRRYEDMKFNKPNNAVDR